jgi:hypothetical protein
VKNLIRRVPIAGEPDDPIPARQLCQVGGNPSLKPGGHDRVEGGDAGG